MDQKLRKIHRVGAVPFSNFKEKIRIVNQLRTQFGKIARISIENDIILYEYFELQ